MMTMLGLGCGGTSDSTSTTAPSSSPHVEFVGFDTSPPLVAALEAGELQGLVVQNPYLMGEKAVQMLVLSLQKQPGVEREVSTGATLVTPENMKDSGVDQLLHPPKMGHATDISLTSKRSKKWRLMVIPKGTTHEHWRTVHAGAVKAAEELGDVEIVWQGSQKEDDRTEQIKLVQSAVAARVDGIALAPLDSKALVAPVEEAIAAGIPVVIFDSALESTKPISYVATDNYRGGVLAAERLAERLKGKGKVIMMRYAVGSAATEEREQGFLDTIKPYPNITIISDDQYAGATSDSAQRTAQSLVTRFRGQVDGVFCPNESSTAGMLRALEDAGMLQGDAR
jgi:ribose transport system substrate-binding protein